MNSLSAFVLAAAAGASLVNAAALDESWLKEKRTLSTDGRCGTGFGTTCSSTECCSSAGWCGNGYLYCSAPSCQLDYGPACDANVKPDGPDTTDLARPALGSVPYGEAIYHCEEYGDIALTYDDGPYNYTEYLLDLLLEYDAKATFFITGRNLGKGAINDPTTPWPALIKRMAAEGHQIASHTWSHQRLTTLSKEKFWNQMIYNEIAFADLLGYFPTYMRPPYSASNDTTDAWLGELGYHITYFNLDTEGYLHDSADLIQDSKDIWDAAVEGMDTATTKWLEIEHDPVYQSVHNLTEYMLKSLFANGFKSVTVGECLGDDKANWYRNIDGSSTGTSTSTTKTSTSTSTSTATGTYPATTDGRCGPSYSDQTCSEESDDICCSPAGWCGSTTDHCGTGCQSLFGTCDSSTTTTTTSKASTQSSSTSSASTSSTSSSAGTTSTTSTSTTSTTSTSTTSTSASTSSQPATTNGRCGPSYSDMTCKYEPLGATCCSPAGWCGSTTDHCGTGCQSSYGTCGTSSSSSSSSSSSIISSSSTTKTTTTSTTTASQPATTNGRCGASYNGQTCKYEPLSATCCSSAGWCGSTTAHCGTGCQSAYGTCS